MNKIEGLNYLRALSMFFIIIGHICLSRGVEETGRYFGYVFVDVFFVLSALLLGLKYGDKQLEGKFLLKRYVRLSCTYYPFLLLSLLILTILGEKITILNVISHFTYVNYILRYTICGSSFGHLWFLSLIMMCYVEVTILSRLKLGHSVFHIPLLLISLALCVCCGYISEEHKIPNRIVLVLFFFGYVFFNAKQCLSWFMNFSIKTDITLVIIINLITWFLFNTDIIGDNNRLTRDWIVLAAALTWFPFFCKIKTSIRFSRIVDFFSAISFEMYLVHHPFVLGKFSVFTYLSPVGGVLTIFFITIVLASFLHILSAKITKAIKI